MIFNVWGVSSRRAPRTPAIPWAYYAPTISAAEPALVLCLKANHIEQKRRVVKTLSFSHNNSYPLNNTFDTAYFPAFKNPPTHRTEQKRRLQVATLGYYQPTSTALVAGAPTEPDVDRGLPSRRLLRPPQITYVSPQTFTAQSYPAWGVKQFRTEFKRKLQTFDLKYFEELPATPEQAPSAYKTHFEKTRQTQRTLRTVTPIPFAQERTYPATWPAFKRVETNNVSFHRDLIDQPDPVYTRPETSASVSFGPSQPLSINKVRSRRIQPQGRINSGYSIFNNAPAEPATIFEPKAIRVEFKTRLLVPPVHNFYPQPVFSEASVAAVTPVRAQRTRKTEAHEVEYVGIIYDTLSYAPYPSYLAPEVHRRHGWRELRDHAELLYYPPTPPTPEQPLTAFQPDPVFRTSFKRTLQTIPIHLEYPRTEPSVIAWMPVRSIKRKETKRQHRVVELILERPQTPPIPFQASSLVRFDLPRMRPLKRRLLKPTDFGGYAFAPDIAGAFRSGFKPEIAYLRGIMKDVGYLDGDITDTGYVLTWLGHYDAYLEGDITDVGYFESDMDAY